MKTVFLLVAVVLTAGLQTIGAQQTNAQGEKLLAAAQHKATVDGDLKGAIDDYKKIVAGAGGNRALTAQALVRMAECYQKLGDAESRKIYEQLLREYADQKEAAAEARARLGGVELARQTSTLVWVPINPSVDQVEGTISPDGRHLSFIDWETGDLELHDFGTGSDRNITHPGGGPPVNCGNCYTEYAEESAISKDGKQIAYTWWQDAARRAELRIASLQGEPHPRTLYDNPDVGWVSVFDWSPDGKLIAVQVERVDHTKQIGLVSVSDRSLRILKSVDWRGAGRIFFSPDGQYVGFDLPQSDSSPQRDVFVLSVDGGRETRAVAHPGNDVMMGWSGDGRWLLFASDRTGSSSLWGIVFAGGKLEGAPRLLRSDFPALARPLGVSRSGRMFYAIAEARQLRIYTASFDFAAGRFLSAPMAIPQDSAASHAAQAWLPQGKRLSYSVVRGSSRNSSIALAIRSIDTGDVREIFPKLAYFDDGKWSPDGRWFATRGQDLKGRWGIFQIDAETGDALPVVFDSPGETAGYPGAWAADGKSIYFPRAYRATQDRTLIQRDLASGQERVLIRGAAYDRGPNISPDGRYMAAAGADVATNSRILRVIPVAGGEPRELLRMPSETTPGLLMALDTGVSFSVPSWAPDSQSLLVWKKRQGPTNSELWQVFVDGRQPRRVQAPPIAVAANSFFAVNADGTLAFRYKELGNREVWALDNFLPAEPGSKQSAKK